MSTPPNDGTYLGPGPETPAAGSEGTYLGPPPETVAADGTYLGAPAPVNGQTSIPTVAGPVGNTPADHRTVGMTMLGATALAAAAGPFRIATNPNLPPDNRLLDQSLQLSRLSVFPDVAARSGDSLPEAIRQRLAQQVSDGRYAVRRFLAAGGMGAVLEIDDHDFGRRSAIKIIKPAARAHAGILERFLEEARITAQLEHPNIVPIHDLGVLADGTIFFTMKFIQGRSLGDVVKKLREKDAATVAEWNESAILLAFLKVLDGVGFAHSRQVIHRDLKPDNIMIDAHGEVLVVDWGIAKALASGLAEPQGDQAMPSGSLNATIAGSAMGSLHYMPPEQAVGALDRIDARSDIYALGATLQEMLTHQRPRTGAGAEALLELARAGKLTPLDDVAPTLHPDLAAIIRRAAAPAPEHRYPTCAALSADLRAYLEGRAVSARQRSLLERSAAWIAAHRVPVALGAAGLALAGGAAVAGLEWAAARDRQAATALVSRAATANPDDAVELLGQAQVLVPTDAGIAAALERARAAKADQDRRREAEAQATARAAEAARQAAEGRTRAAAGELEAAERALALAYQLAPTDTAIEQDLRTVRRTLDDRARDARVAAAHARRDQGLTALTEARTAHQRHDAPACDRAIAAAAEAFTLASKDGYTPTDLPAAAADLAVFRAEVAKARAVAAQQSEALALTARARQALLDNHLEEARDRAVAALGLHPGLADAESLRVAAVDRLRVAEELRRREAAEAEAVGTATASLARAREADSARAAAVARRTAAQERVTTLGTSLRAVALDAKTALWTAHQDLHAATEAENAAESTLESQALAAWTALASRPDHPVRTAAATLLADTYLRRAQAAEAIGDAAAMRSYLAALTPFDDGSRRASLEQPVALHLTGAAGATLTVHRLAPGPYTRLAPSGEAVATLTLPAATVTLPPGRYVLSATGRTAAVTLRPGSPVTLTWPDRAPAIPGLGFQWVARPGGGFWLSTDEITHEQYLASVLDPSVLPSVLASVGGDLLLVPRTSPKVSVWPLRDGRFSVPAALAGTPVTNIARDDALAYAAWVSVTHQVRARLPTADEWAFAATAGDAARTWPWGEVFDAGFAVTAHQGANGPAPVASATADLGPFGHRHLGGNVREWLAPGADEAVGTLTGAVAGGGWGDERPDAFAGRAIERVPADVLTPAIGFRLVIEESP